MKRPVNHQPYRRGFYCDDETINKPYLPSTVRWNDEIIVASVLVILMIVLIECLQYCTDRNKNLLPGYTIGSITCNDFLVKTYTYVGIYCFGLAFCMSFKDIGKFTIGRLRPHFLTVCKPAWGTFNCSGPIPGAMRYVEEDVCTGDPEKIWEARQSFPSGHSSLGFFSMVYLAIYIQARITWKFSRLLRHLLQACVLWMALFATLSRVSDYKHHPTDVLAGACLGILCCIFTVFWVPELFFPTQESEDAIKDFGRKTSVLPLKKISRASKASGGSLNQMPDTNRVHNLEDP